jgi:hypothetical protein
MSERASCCHGQWNFCCAAVPNQIEIIQTCIRVEYRRSNIVGLHYAAYRREGTRLGKKNSAMAACCQSVKAERLATKRRAKDHPEAASSKPRRN